MNSQKLDRILDVLEFDVLPLTEAAVRQRNKIFGAAILERHTLELVVSGTNDETRNPLFHGEVVALNQFWALKASHRPAPADCLFISTHEPCSLCLSAITWSGFDNFYYLFSYEDSRDAFSIPHDLKIMTEVFGLNDGQYRRTNAFWQAYRLAELIATQAPDEQTRLQQRIKTLRACYDNLSTQYQESKSVSNIPLA